MVMLNTKVSSGPMSVATGSPTANAVANSDVSSRETVTVTSSMSTWCVNVCKAGSSCTASWSTSAVFSSSVPSSDASTTIVSYSMMTVFAMGNVSPRAPDASSEAVRDVVVADVIVHAGSRPTPPLMAT